MTPLNKTVHQISGLSENLIPPAGTYASEYQELAKRLETLKNSIANQLALIEEFKTNNAVLQDSLYDYSRLQTEILADSNNNASAELVGKLSTLLL